MIEIPLTRGYVAIVDDEDAHLAAFKWSACVRGGRVYAYRTRRREEGAGPIKVYLHREVLRPGCAQQVDHADGDGLNCRRSNLRAASASQNLANRAGRGRGLKGVSFHQHSGLWRAEVMHDGVREYLGYFSDPKAAARAYDDAARRHFGAFARPNFPEVVA